MLILVNWYPWLVVECPKCGVLSSTNVRHQRTCVEVASYCSVLEPNRVGARRVAGHGDWMDNVQKRREKPVDAAVTPLTIRPLGN